MDQTNLGASKNRQREQTRGHCDIALNALEDNRTHIATSSFSSKVLSTKIQYSIVPMIGPSRPRRI